MFETPPAAFEAASPSRTTELSDAPDSSEEPAVATADVLCAAASDDRPVSAYDTVPKPIICRQRSAVTNTATGRRHPSRRIRRLIARLSEGSADASATLERRVLDMETPISPIVANTGARRIDPGHAEAHYSISPVAKQRLFANTRMLETHSLLPSPASGAMSRGGGQKYIYIYGGYYTY